MSTVEEKSCKRDSSALKSENGPYPEIIKKQKIEKDIGNKSNKVVNTDTEPGSPAKTQIDGVQVTKISKSEGPSKDEELSKDKKEEAGDEETNRSKEAPAPDNRTGDVIKKDTITADEDVNAEKPKFVFGASSSFSSGFGVASKPFGASSIFSNGFDVAKKDVPTQKQDVEIKPASSFGQGLAFESGFKSTKAATEGEDSNEKTEEESEENTTSSTPVAEPSLKLTKQDVKSGEELENSLYQTNAKLYQLSNIKEGWKERGVGVLHVNKDENSGKSRIVMRSRGLLKVILNLPLVKSFTIQKGFPGSLTGDKFVRILAVDSDNHPVQYALKVGKSETADELFDNITKLIPKE